MSVLRTDYRNPDGDRTPRPDATRRAESLRDLEGYFRPLGQAAVRAVAGFGVHDGLRLSAKLNSADLLVSPGTAQDRRGNLVVLAVSGFAVVDPGVVADQVLDVPKVVVDKTGVVLSTADFSGDVVVLIRWHESPGTGPFELLHAPWLRLLSLKNKDLFNPDLDVVLGVASLDGSGAVTGLRVGERRHVEVAAQQVALRVPAAAADAVQQQVAAVVAGRPGGGLEIGLPGPTPRTALTVDALGQVDLPGGLRTSTLRVSGDAVVGAGGDDSLAVRFLKGKSGKDDSDDDLYLNAATGKAVHVGSAKQPANLQVSGDAVVGVGGDGSLTVRHLKGKSGKDDSDDDLYLNAATGKAVHVGSVKHPANLLIVGDVSIGLGDTPASRTLHIEGKGIHSGGGGAGLSFADRAVSGFVETPDKGQRWVWYAAKGTARLWSGSDRLSIDPAGNLTLGGALAVAGGLSVGGALSVAGGLSVGGGLSVAGADLAVSGKHALRGSDSWLRLNQDGAFSSGVHTPGLFHPGSLNVGGTTNPGTGNVAISGVVDIAGKRALQGGDSWLRLNQDGAFSSGVHTPGLFHPGSLNVGGTSNPGTNNASIAGNLRVHGAINWADEHADIGWIRLGRLQLCWGLGSFPNKYGEFQTPRIGFNPGFATTPCVTVTLNDPGYGVETLQAGVGAYQVDQNGFIVLFKSNRAQQGWIYYNWLAVGRWA
jgi:hypothetical protein